MSYKHYKHLTTTNFNGLAERLKEMKKPYVKRKFSDRNPK